MDDFRKEKVEIDAEEVKAIAAHNSAAQGVARVRAVQGTAARTTSSRGTSARVAAAWGIVGRGAGPREARPRGGERQRDAQ